MSGFGDFDSRLFPVGKLDSSFAISKPGSFGSATRIAIDYPLDMTEKNSTIENPKVSPAGWAWLLAVSCFAIALLSKMVAPPKYFLPFAILGIGAGITVLQGSRPARIPVKKRMAFCALVAATAWIAFGVILAMIPPAVAAAP